MRDDSLRTGDDVVREVLAALAPGELPYLESVLEAYRIDPWSLGAGGAGIPVDQVTAWAPFVLGFVAETVVGISGEPADGGRRRGFAALLDRWRRPRTDELANVPDTPVPAFDQEQLRRVRAAAGTAATDRGYSPGDREAFAAAIVAALAVGHLPQPRRPRG